MRKCKCGCGASIEQKHPNAKFLNQRHKDKFHNLNNPKGKYAHLSDIQDHEDDIYSEYDKSLHPFSPEGLGQD